MSESCLCTASEAKVCNNSRDTKVYDTYIPWNFDNLAGLLASPKQAKDPEEADRSFGNCGACKLNTMET